MKNVPWGKIGAMAFRVGTGILMGVPIAERAATQFKGASGADKANTVLEAALSELALAGQVSGAHVAPTPEVEAALRALIDATVTLHNALAHSTAAPIA